MEINLEVENKIKHILLGISQHKREESLIEILNNSQFFFETNYYTSTQYNTVYNITLKITPDIFTKFYDSKNIWERTLESRINNSSPLTINKVILMPDYEKLQIVNSHVFPVMTDWETINNWQNKIIKDLQQIYHQSDIQNIGNTARNIMNMLAKNVFDSSKHKSTRDISGDKYKNQLLAYIENSLAGEKNKEFRNVAKSSIEFLADAIELMHKLDHSLNADKHLAEVCVISTISAVSIINLIKQLE